MAENKAGTAAPPAKKSTVWSKVGKILLYGWMFILIFIFGMIILISSLLKGC